MGLVSSLISELEDSIARGSGEQRIETLRRVTDLFLIEPTALAEAHVEVFDLVIARLTAAIETRARVELAERLADVPNAPPGVIRSLAHDEIVVARPVLSRSARLSDEDLVSVALARGRDHMLAISERPALSEIVTDILVSRGDDVVHHAVTGNVGARFSLRSYDMLIERARADAALRSLLGQRVDIPAEKMRNLIAIAKDSARQRLGDSLAADPRTIGHVVDVSADLVAQRVDHAGRHRHEGPNDYAAAMARMSDLAERGALSEKVLIERAQALAFEDTVCAVSILAHVSVATAERLFTGNDLDLLVIVCRAQDWSWSTLKTLMRLRVGEAISERQHDKALESFEQLNQVTALRVLRFLHVREATQQRRPLNS
jgi:uncharacterized protein (DUF2336 family)